jgi:hypothetical protein
VKPARSAKALALAAVAVVSLVASVGATPSPIAAVPQTVSLSLTEGGGQLVLRDAEEPAEIESPTTIVGTADDSTGAIAGTFSTPVMEFELPVPDLNTTAYVDATFTETAPGVTTGAATLVDGDQTQANISLSTTLKVDLHIEVGSPALVVADCTSSPISLGLTSVAPYDSDVGEVTLVDENFTVPPVPVTGTCPDFIAPRVNASLEGSGHSISLAMAGELPLPTAGTEDTITTLVVDPTPDVRLGETVTLTADVVPAPGELPGVPTGQVEFRAGSTILGAAALNASGQAVLTTDSLPVAQHQIQARYVGDEVYRASFSTPVPLLVAADPTVAVEMADNVLYGGPARSIKVDVANPLLGRDVTNGRVDIVLKRNESTNFLNADAIRLEWLNGDAWERIPLTYDSVARVAKGSIGPAGGAPLPVGASIRHNLRLFMPDPIDAPAPTTCTTVSPPCIGDWELSFALAEVVPGDGAVIDDLATAVHSFVLVEQTRRATTLTLSGGAPRPHTARQNTTIDVAVSVGPTIGGAGPSGLFELFVDGRRTPARSPNMPYEDGYVNQVPMGTGLALLQFPVGDLEPGRHLVTARYLGDALFAPAEITTSFTVLPATGYPFVCRTPNQNGNNWFGVGMTYAADVPAVATAGSTVDLDVSAAGWAMSRPGLLNPFPSLPNNATATVGAEGSLLDGVSFTLGSLGTGSAQTANRTFGTAIASSPNPADVSQVDQKITFGGLAASVAVDGEPGDIVPITLDQVVMTMHLSGGIPLPTVTTCTAVGGPMELGEVEIAGTSVTATPSPAREITDEVDIEAETFPAAAGGTVSFSSDLDGALGDVAVDDGSATLSTDELSPGTHVITASFNATDADVPDTQGTVTVTVQYSPRSGTEAFVVAARTDFTGAADEDDVVSDGEDLDAGLTKAAYLNALAKSDAYLTYVVNQMYLDTLGREGDESGVAFWVEKLQSGYPIAKVAASFYGSAEYYARVGGTDEAWVRDLYQTLLGREAEATGLAYWVGEIPKRGRGGVALAFYQEPESLAFRVTNLYDFLLDRAPSAADITYWSPIVKKRGDLALSVFLAASDEYADRAEERFPIIT